MKAVIQRVTYSNLSIDNKIYSQIKRGLVVLLGITHYDDDNDIEWLAKKIVNLRIFNDDKNIHQCRICGNRSNFGKIDIPYACKLLFQELVTMNIYN